MRVSKINAREEFNSRVAAVQMAEEAGYMKTIMRPYYEAMLLSIQEYANEHNICLFIGGVLAEKLPGADNYESLRAVLDEAFAHASAGKGKERHGDDEPFEDQVTCEIQRRLGAGYTKGQAVKKIYESDRLPGERGVAELLGAINYIAAAIIGIRRQS